MSSQKQKSLLSKSAKDLLAKLKKKHRLEIALLKEKYEEKIHTLSTILENTPGSLYWKSEKGVYLGHNKFAADLMRDLGLENNIIGKTDYDLFRKEVADKFKEADVKALAGNIYADEEITLLPNGEQLIQFSTKMPLRNKHNYIIGIIGITIDITRLKQVEQDLRYAKERAEDANKAKTRFVMDMSHDLRTPLIGVIGLADLINEQATGSQERHYGKMISGAGSELLKLLNYVLDIIVADNTTEEDLQIESISLAQLAKELHTLITPSIEVKGLRFTITLDPTLPVAIATDAIKLQRILLNLLTNAIKFTEKGIIDLSIDLLSKHTERAEIEIRISDTGMGMPLDKQDKIFERFYRINPSYEGIYKGYGVGLYLVKKYLKLLKGDINVVSKEKKGTCFILRFSFPLGKTTRLKNYPINKPIEKVTDSLENSVDRVLVVEDNKLIFHSINHLLKNCGYHQVTVAVNGKIALQYLQEYLFKWILLDMRLPDITGIDLVKQYRVEQQRKGKPLIPIFALTAQLDDNIASQCKKNGIEKVFKKPLNKTDIESIRQFFNRND